MGGFSRVLTSTRRKNNGRLTPYPVSSQTRSTSWPLVILSSLITYYDTNNISQCCFTMIQQVLSCQTDLSTIPKKLLGSDKRKRRKEIYKPKKSLVRYFNTVDVCMPGQQQMPAYSLVMFRLSRREKCCHD